MDIKGLKAKIEEQQFKLKKAKSRGMMVAQETERMRNLLVNYLDEIVEALEYAESAQGTIERLTVEIESADAELQEKDEEIRELKKPAAKAKKKEVAEADVK